MMEYSKKSKLDNNTIESIKQVQKQIIMNRILNSKTKHHSFKLSPLKLAFVVIFVLLVVIIPLSLQIGDTVIIPTEYSIQDVYVKLVDYQERLENVEFNNNEEINNILESNNQTGLVRLANVTKVYSRTELDDIYMNQVLNVEEGEYIENYFNVELFLNSVIEMIESNQDIPLEEFVEVDEDLYRYNKFKFTYVGEDYIVIKAINTTYGVINGRTGFKIGLLDDLVDISVIDYSFDPMSWLEDDEDKINYNYFEFLQDSYALSLNSYLSYYTMNYVSLIDGKSISVSRGQGVTEGEEQNEDEFVFHLYDKQSKFSTFISMINNEVIAESYTVYDDRGTIFSYSDYDMTDNFVTIKWNMMLTDGWDQVAYKDESGYGYKEEGLYLEGELLDIDGSIRVIYGTNGVSVLLSRDFSITELNDSLLALEDILVTWNSEIPTLEYIASIQIRDLSILTTLSQIEGLDFFVDDIRLELYNYLDSDIKNVIE